MVYKIGQVIYKDTPVIINKDKNVKKISVSNQGDRSIQVCSHYHFFESNLALSFNREEGFGMHLDIPSGTAVRFEPGEVKEVQLVPFSGNGRVIGFLGLTMGDLDEPSVKTHALKKLKELEGSENNGSNPYAK